MVAATADAGAETGAADVVVDGAVEKENCPAAGVAADVAPPKLNAGAPDGGTEKLENEFPIGFAVGVGLMVLLVAVPPVAAVFPNENVLAEVGLVVPPPKVKAGADDVVTGVELVPLGGAAEDELDGKLKFSAGAEAAVAVPG